MAPQKSYEAEDTQVLEDLEHVRLRPGMYIMDTGAAGYFQLLKEVLDNSIDEHMGGNGNKILVLVDVKGKRFLIQDYGRGVPIEIHPKTGIPTVTTLFTKLHAGGKFHRTAYDKAVGLHGVGVKATNALSKWLRVTTTRKHRSHTQTFEKGEPTSELIRVKEKAKHESGTRVEFKPDPIIFGGDQKPNPETVHDLLTNTAYLCPKLTILYKVLSDREEKFKIQKKGGLRQMVEDTADKQEIEFLHDILTYQDEDLDVAFVWTKKAGERLMSFVNATPIPDGGTHVSGFRRAITRVMGSLTKDKYNTDDLRDGLMVAIHVKVSDPLFKGQTKTQLLSKEVGKMVSERIGPVLKQWIKDDKESALMIVNKAVHLYKARKNYKKVASQLRNIGKASGRRGLLPDCLAEAPFCDPEQRELYVVEGKSAGGSAKKARDPHFQEVLSLRGKIPNAIRTTPGKLLANAEIKSLIAAIGCGIDQEGIDRCDPEKSRVGKVLLLMDADPDGHHITALSISFLVKYMRPLISAGTVYVVKSPLFKASHRDKHVFGDSLKVVLKAFPSNVTPQISRFKGHGEASEEEIREYAMDPLTRKIYQLQIKREGRDYILDLMGSDVKFRKELLGLV